jgi:hypothetical protein
MQYYTFELPNKARKHRVIITLSGECQYNVAPMAVKHSPDFAQEEVMEDIFYDLDDVEVYILTTSLYGHMMVPHAEKLKTEVLA